MTPIDAESRQIPHLEALDYVVPFCLAEPLCSICRHVWFIFPERGPGWDTPNT